MFLVGPFLEFGKTSLNGKIPTFQHVSHEIFPILLRKESLNLYCSISQLYDAVLDEK